MAGMTDETTIAYTALAKGTPILTAEGTELGTVEHVLQDPSIDLFDGIAVKTSAGLRFVDADLVGRITTAAVHTTLTVDDAAALPEPQGTEVLDADPNEYEGNGLSAWFGRVFLREHWMRRKNE
ncbi:hypothetical protein GCM10009617_26870 [Leifsonia poae]|uniref:PRC-barrel domain containing protein n=2 Tax=Leifsonia poae TaxID=110933 RepID=A0A9W6HC88_9MICO|nr:hypothetical protein GCM10017584_26970 [Leifsonia poae]